MNDFDSKTRSHIEDVIDSWRRERSDLDLSDFLLAVCVMRLGRVVDDAYDRMCRKRFGISGADMRVLLALRRAGKPYARRPTDLFRALLVTSGAMTKQVDRLSGLGFVERLDGADSARPLIALTSKGLKAANTATDLLATNSPVAPGVRDFSSAEYAAGQRFVQTLLTKIEQSTAQDGEERQNRPSARRRKRTGKAR
jgi:DNA-binding MarR family transcriptional regulator